VATVAAETARPGDEVSLGRVFNLAFATIAAQPFTTFGLAFIAGALPSRLVEIAREQVPPLIFDRFGILGNIVVALGVLLVVVAVGAVGQAALVPPVWCRAEKRRVGFGESLAAVASALGPLLLVGFLTGFGVALGGLALVVPGLILACVWAAAVPAVVVERRGPLEALRRSADLTRHARWRVFALLLLQGVVSVAIGFVVRRLLFALAATPAYFVVDVAGVRLSVATQVLQALVQTVTQLVFGCLWAALYIELRDCKDGPPTDALAHVFE
jgi:hypothetical protein